MRRCVVFSPGWQEERSGTSFGIAWCCLTESSDTGTITSGNTHTDIQPVVLEWSISMKERSYTLASTVHLQKMSGFSSAETTGQTG